jgi:uncharacterized short protein YbdD (DUF466 family)
MQNKLKTMRTKNPKEIWKILNKGKKKEQPNIPVDTFFEFYKELNQKQVYLGSLIWLLVENCLGHIYFLCF